MSLVDFRSNARPIGLLSVGYVAFTTVTIGFITWWLLLVPLAAAFALGAVVAPPSTSNARGDLTAAELDLPGCPDLREAAHNDVPEPRTPNGCEECLRGGTRWVHLRLCLSCGHVGCCDSSEERHADRHFRDTAHPVMRSFEPDELWRWCYIHEQVG